MDKLKNGLAVVKKHHFWILCAMIVVAGSVVTWSMAKPSVSTLFEERKTAIDGDFSSVRAVSNTADHPNEDVIARHEKATDLVKRDVFNAWTKLYDEQKRLNQLPQQFSQQFRDRFASVLEAAARGEALALSTTERDEYRRFIRGHFTTLFADLCVCALPVDEDADPSAPEPKEIVYWDAVSRDGLLVGFGWTRRPNTEQVLLAQEDLWVYEALMRIIGAVNANATSPYDASIKEILALRIGQNAVVGSASGAYDPAGAQGGRYVDDEGKLIGPESEHPYAEFKIMPIYMRVKINQMKIPDLLVECANSSMPVEVTRLRINPGEGESIDVEAYAGNLETFGDSRDEGGSSMMSTKSGVEESVLDAVVAIRGQIYIYNPPDQEAVGTGAAAEEAMEAAMEAATGPAEEAADETTDPAEAPAEDPTGATADPADSAHLEHSPTQVPTAVAVR